MEEIPRNLLLVEKSGKYMLHPDLANYLEILGFKRLQSKRLQLLTLIGQIDVRHGENKRAGGTLTVIRGT